MKKTIVVVLFLYFVQGLIHNLGHPVTPTFVEYRNIPDYMFGLFFAAMSLGLTIGGPIWGILGDRGNKRTYMSLGLVIYSIGQFGFAFFDDVYIMILFRFISGSYDTFFSIVPQPMTSDWKFLVWQRGGEVQGKNSRNFRNLLDYNGTLYFCIGGICGGCKGHTLLQ